nr:helix-turn-helix transcriptional regulator [uncultured Albidiferax sp.]
MKNGAEFEQRWATAIGVVLRDIRKAADLVQEEVAFKSGIGRASLQQIEHGRTAIRLITLVKLCGELQVEPDSVIAQARTLVSSPARFKKAVENLEKDSVRGRPPGTKSRTI